MKYLFFALFLILQLPLLAQSLLQPGSADFNKKHIQSTKYEMTCFAFSGKQQVEVGSFNVEVNVSSKTVSVYTTLLMLSTKEKWIDTTIADATQLKPIYRSSTNPNRVLSLRYSNEVTGYYIDKKTNQKNQVREPVKEFFFDSYIYPYLLGSLPLTSGHRAHLPVFDYKPGNENNVKATRIEEVKSNLYKSQYSGSHPVWQISVFEEATNEKYEYYIDKETRRMWKIETTGADNQKFVLVNKEIDFDLVVKTAFDKEATMKLLKEGSAVIKGVAYAKDNPANETFLKNKSVVNINKKQYAPIGTTVILIPATAYFKEWISVNEQLQKKGRPIPLTKEAVECIQVTTVYDEKGQFEFTNLMQGDYYLYTEFAYVKTRTQTEVVGYTDTYINGFFQGSSERTKDYHVTSSGAAGIKKLISIKKAGETISVTLKKTGSLL